jgi:hypothetical protein
MKELSEMTPEEIESEQVLKETEYQLAMQSLFEVETKDNQISRDITELQLERKRLADSLIKAKYNLRRIASELRNLKTMFFKKKAGL